MSKSMSFIFRLGLLTVLDPLKHRRADRRIEKDTLALIQAIVVAYFSPFLLAINSANLLWYLLHSSGILPMVVNTNGVNVPCPTSMTRLAYAFSRFHVDDIFAVGLGLCKILHWGGMPVHQRMQISVFPKTLWHEHRDEHQVVGTSV